LADPYQFFSNVQSRFFFLDLILTYFPQNQKLHLENRLLLEKTSDLICENEELRQRLGLDTLEEKEQVKTVNQTGFVILVVAKLVVNRAVKYCFCFRFPLTPLVLF